jgi:hypothetical protein
VEESSGKVFGADDADVTPPLTMRQSFPVARSEWTSMRSRGLLEVIVNEAGQVESARMLRPMHPAYNNLLLQETKFWRYQPAVRHGAPVRYRRLIEITVGRPQT